MPNEPTPEQKPADSSRFLGNALVAGGALAMVAIAILSRPLHGGAIAAAFFMVIVGLVLRFPTLVQDGSKAADNSANVSAMRVAVLLIVSIFGLLTIKAGWNAPRLEDLKPDSTWIGVLGVAFGGKVFQSFAENQGPKQ